MQTIWKWLTDPTPPSIWAFMLPVGLLALFFVVAVEVRAEQKSEHVRALLSEAYCVAPAAITK